MTKGKQILFYSTLVIIGTYYLFFGLAKAQGILSPLTFAAILSLVILPLSKWMEKKGLKRVYSSLLNAFLIFLVSVGFLAIISFQVKSFVDDWPEIKKTMEPKVEQLKAFVLEHTPIDESDLQQLEQQNGAPGPLSNQGENVIQVLNITLSFFGNYLLTFIYIFFMLNYRKRFKKFILNLFPDVKKPEVEEIVQKSAYVVQQYLIGKLILIGILAVLYAIGLGLSGVSNFILVSLIAAILSLIPYFGNIIGFFLALVLGYLTSGEILVLVGIIVTFSVAQFVESYILEPYVVGEKVDLHPFFVILAVIVGGAVWGVGGMIISIPILAILTIVFLHVSSLHPYGYLFSQNPPD